jgi:hypothetical protein
LRPEERLPTLSSSEIIVLVSFSTLYTLNIVVSNASLQLVTVPVRFRPSYYPSILALTLTGVSSAVSSSCPILRALLHAHPLRYVNSLKNKPVKSDIPNPCSSGRWPCVSCATLFNPIFTHDISFSSFCQTTMNEPLSLV